MKTKIHILSYAAALCGFTSAFPSRWPPGHHWVDPTDADEATCRECIDEFRRMQEDEGLNEAVE